MTPSWPATLDAFGHHLDVQGALVGDGRYDEVVAFEPPAGLPPIPRVLAARASELLGRAQALSDLAATMRDETAQRLTRSRRPAFARPHVTAYFDQLA